VTLDKLFNPFEFGSYDTFLKNYCKEKEREKVYKSLSNTLATITGSFYYVVFILRLLNSYFLYFIKY